MADLNRDFDSVLGRRIRKHRRSQKLTQDQLAARLQVEGCDLTRSAIAKIEVGQRRISCREMRYFCNILGIAYAVLLDG